MTSTSNDEDVASVSSEVSKSAITDEFDALLSDPKGIRAFMNFLTGCHCEENLEFWLAVKNYKQLFIHGEPGREPAAQPNAARIIEPQSRAIYDTFISQWAWKQVNIYGEIRATVEQQIEMPHEHLFDEAAKEIYRLMHGDPYIRFTQSHEYQKFMAEQKKCAEDGAKSPSNNQDGTGKRQHGHGSCFEWLMASKVEPEEADPKAHAKKISKLSPGREKMLSAGRVQDSLRLHRGRLRSSSMDASAILHQHHGGPLQGQVAKSAEALEEPSDDGAFDVKFGPVFEVPRAGGPTRRSSAPSLGLPPVAPYCTLHHPDGSIFHVTLLDGHSIQDMVQRALRKWSKSSAMPFTLYGEHLKEPIDVKQESMELQFKHVWLEKGPLDVDGIMKRGAAGATPQQGNPEKTYPSTGIVEAGITLIKPIVPLIFRGKAKSVSDLLTPQVNNHPSIRGLRRSSAGPLLIGTMKNPVLSYMRKQQQQQQQQTKKKASSLDTLLEAPESPTSPTTFHYGSQLFMTIGIEDSLRRVQRRASMGRLDDQRGTALNCQLPDFLKKLPAAGASSEDVNQE